MTLALLILAAAFVGVLAALLKSGSDDDDAMEAMDFPDLHAERLARETRVEVEYVAYLVAERN